MNIHPLITDTDSLAHLCARLAAADFCTVDTEFMRESTYYPDLCLVQLASSHEAAAVDPKAPGINLEPMFELLNKREVLKVVHAGGQDLEIFYNLSGALPNAIFDTQIAAMAMGLGEQVSYNNLVGSLIGAQLDKGARFTDWARRPLDQRQLDYAIADVTYLAKLFPKMLDKLRRTGRGAWLDEEMARLTEPANYRNDPETAWTRLRLPNRKPEVLGRLKALAAWREREAQNKDVPRGRIVKDETLADMAGSPPREQSDLARIRGLSNSWANNDIGRRLMTALVAAQPLPHDEMPARDERRPGLNADATLIADLLKLLMKIRAKEADVAPKLIGRSDELEAIAAGQRDGLPILTGWRYDIFGRDALDLVEGRLSFCVEQGRLKMTNLSGDIVDDTPID